MNKEQRKKLTEQYKQRRRLGGVYRIRNTVSGRCYLNWDEDLAGAENRHNFTMQFDSCPLPALQADWREHGPRSFVFERLEELEQGPDQGLEAFHEDLRILYELWQERDGDGAAPQAKMERSP